jgi:hypothetical protein
LTTRIGTLIHPRPFEVNENAFHHTVFHDRQGESFSGAESGRRNLAPARRKNPQGATESIGDIETFDWTNSSCASTLRIVNAGVAS